MNLIRKYVDSVERAFELDYQKRMDKAVKKTLISGASPDGAILDRCHGHVLIRMGAHSTTTRIWIARHSDETNRWAEQWFLNRWPSS